MKEVQEITDGFWVGDSTECFYQGISGHDSTWGSFAMGVTVKEACTRGKAGGGLTPKACSGGRRNKASGEGRSSSKGFKGKTGEKGGGKK